LKLEGVRVLVPRPRSRAEALCFLLEDEGAVVLNLPVLELSPPDDPRPLQAAAEQIQRYEWVAFASPSGVEALVDAARAAGTLDRLRRLSVAAVGPRTAKAATDAGLSVRVESATATGAGLAQTLTGKVATGDSVLLPAAQEGRPELEEGLRAAGANVTRVAAYRADQLTPAPEALEAVRAAPPQAVVFGSPRTVEAFLDVTGAEGRRWLDHAKVVAIGPTTAAAAKGLGLAIAAVASQPTPEAMVEATFQALRG
jgi:uroporphyrinogen-III synthase